MPERFEKLESLLQRMPIRCRDGSAGLLSQGQFGDAVHAELPVLNVDDIHDNQLLSGMNKLSSIIITPSHILIHSP